MFDKISRATLALLGALFVGAGVFSVGFVTGSRYNTLLPAVLQSVAPVPASDGVVTVDKITVAPAQGATPEELQTAFKPFWEGEGSELLCGHASVSRGGGLEGELREGRDVAVNPVLELRGGEAEFREVRYAITPQRAEPFGAGCGRCEGLASGEVCCRFFSKF